MSEHGEITSQETDVPLNRMETNGTGVWFFIEHKDDEVDEGSLKLAGEARLLADKLGQETTGIIIGSGVEGLVGQFGSYGIDSAIVVEDDRLGSYIGETYVDILSQLVEPNRPSIILFAASSIGNDLAPRLATKIEAALVANYTEIEIDKERKITVRKAIYGGNAQATIAPLRSPLIGTIDTQSLSEQKTKSPKDTRVRQASVRIEPKTSTTKIIDYLRADPCAVCVSEAEIVIGVGKGLGCVENLDAVEELARVMGASIGGSRRATDERWIADERRIGLTGKTITPRLYLVCGISGAFHHTLSIKGAKLRVVVNKDVNAPIAKMADLMIVGDMQEIIPELTKQLREIIKPAT
ncbi:MAG: electron transfer flavoprotein subunit alpha/FixB family protein [Dehalococcoidia bacterium]|nr:MAG: electron transfer flavoprotein subunit alpha/FixB family protein [Dehalococcoidia bacterium]